MDMDQDRDFYSLDIRELTREALQAMVEGQYSAHAFDPVYQIKKSWVGSSDEGLPLYPQALPEVFLSWADMDTRVPWQPEDFLVIDLETTGLGRGNTIAFLIGLGYYEGGEYTVEQIFLPDLDAELNSFDRLQELLETREVLITFNGKSFDIPILESRLLYHRLWLNLREKKHIDLLHMARRLWKNKLPSCALESLEYYIMGLIRDQELDIDGGLIPQTYNQYLISGDPEPLLRILMHNQLDVLNTAVLFALISSAINEPVDAGADHRLDYLAVARLYQSQGKPDIARQILLDLKEKGHYTPNSIHELGLIHKKENNLQAARECFEIALDLSHPKSLEELCIVLEKAGEYPEALRRATELFEHCQNQPLMDIKNLHLADRRINRLQKKLAKKK